VHLGSAHDRVHPAWLAAAQPTWLVGLRLRAGELTPMAPVDDGPAEFQRRSATRCRGEGPRSKAVGWWTSFGAAGRKKLTKRMSSAVMCIRPEGNGSGGGIRGWWSTVLGAGRLYTVARYSGR
jgi:hypothetical protein